MIQANEFNTFMQSVWADTPIPSNDGGITLQMSPLYDEWHDAHRSVKIKGGRKTRSQTIDGELYYVYQFEDKSRIMVRKDGAALKSCRNNDN